MKNGNKPAYEQRGYVVLANREQTEGIAPDGVRVRAVGSSPLDACWKLCYLSRFGSCWLLSGPVPPGVLATHCLSSNHPGRGCVHWERAPEAGGIRTEDTT